MLDDNYNVKIIDFGDARKVLEEEDEEEEPATPDKEDGGLKPQDFTLRSEDTTGDSTFSAGRPGVAHFKRLHSTSPFSSGGTQRKLVREPSKPSGRRGEYLKPGRPVGRSAGAGRTIRFHYNTCREKVL